MCTCKHRLRYSRERALQGWGNQPTPEPPWEKNIYGYRLLVRVLRGGVVLNVLRGVLVVDLSRGYRREQFSGALADGKPERGGLNHGTHISHRAVSVLL